MGRVKRIWYLSPMRAAKVQASLRIRAVSPEPPLLAHTSSVSRGTFRQKAKSRSPLNGWVCAVKIRLTRSICCEYSLELPTRRFYWAPTTYVLWRIIQNYLLIITKHPPYLFHWYMSRDMTKLTKWLCAQQRFRSAWASAQSDQSFRCLQEETLGP